MLLKILGWFWVITGILFLLKPEMLRGKLKKKGVKKLRKIFFGITLLLSILLIKAAWGIPGILATVLMVLGFIGILKAVFFLKSKAADALIQWLIDQPVNFFRVWAVAQIVFGAIILTT